MTQHAGRKGNARHPLGCRSAHRHCRGVDESVVRDLRDVRRRGTPQTAIWSSLRNFFVVQSRISNSGLVPWRASLNTVGWALRHLHVHFHETKSPQLTRVMQIAWRQGTGHLVLRNRAKRDRRSGESVVLLACMPPRRILFFNAEAVFFVAA